MAKNKRERALKDLALRFRAFSLKLPLTEEEEKTK